jgi:hypothetical protein
VLHAAERAIVAPVVPLLAATVPILDPHFKVLSAWIEESGASRTVEVRADLSGPLEYAGRTLNPLGSDTHGLFQVNITVGGLLQYSGLLLIIALAWPVRTALELPLRLVLCVPLMALLLVLEFPCTVVAEMWTLLRDQFAPDRFNGWLVWSRFLMGGGGLLIAGLLGALVVVAAQRLRRAPPAAFA